MNIKYSVHIWQEANQYISHAMLLDVLSAGPTQEDARKALDEAVHLFSAPVMQQFVPLIRKSKPNQVVIGGLKFVGRGTSGKRTTAESSEHTIQPGKHQSNFARWNLHR